MKITIAHGNTKRRIEGSFYIAGSIEEDAFYIAGSKEELVSLAHQILESCDSLGSNSVNVEPKGWDE